MYEMEKGLRLCDTEKYKIMKTRNIRPVYTTLEFWYGTDKNGTGAIKKSSVHSFTLQFFPMPNNFISAFGTRTKTIINCIISNNSNTSNTSLFFQAKLPDFLGDLIF